ncbi:ribonuclease-like [Sphaerodactylus townsendi]|uniref:ribonuclease-like n=1 Tax=Sphaerodactylus townsendi TaxID=933632 RepID=UPI002025F3EA|nr:ribonuclease-like [Sphaerodactylus townsendi]
MSPKISSWLLLRLAVLLAVLLLQSSEGARYRDFARKHIDHPQTQAANANAYCNLMMQRRGMMRRTCKRTNTFIHSSPGSIQHICRGGGTKVPRTRDRYDSRRRYRVTLCRSRGRYPNCNYRGRRQNRRVRVSCVNRMPVHLAGLR